MEYKHTPGPWKYHMGQYDGQPPHARGYIYPAAHKIEGFNMSTHITGDKYEDRDEVEANARLIASAPELLEALRETLRVLVTPKGFPDAKHRTPEQQAAYTQARQVIAKATAQQ